MRDHMRLLRSYQDYNFFEGSADKGGGVREKAKQLIDLLSNNENIRDEREKARKLRDKFVGIGSGSGGGGGYRGFGSDTGYSGGGGGRDSYSGGGGSSGRYNSRYGNDNASSSSAYGGKDRYSDSGSSYATGGIGSERTSGSKGRYGGGAYDSSNRARYSDDAPESLDTRNTSVSRSGSADAHDHRREQIDRQGSGGQLSAPSSSSKLKVTIKDKGAAPFKNQPAQAHAPVQQEVDLFNDPSVGHSSSDQFGDFASKCCNISASYLS
jgi:epsin